MYVEPALVQSASDLSLESDCEWRIELNTAARFRPWADK